jgi:hypothetical protein
MPKKSKSPKKGWLTKPKKQKSGTSGPETPKKQTETSSDVKENVVKTHKWEAGKPEINNGPGKALLSNALVVDASGHGKENSFPKRIQAIS